MNSRPPAVAGMFYPDNRRQLLEEVDHFIAGAAPAAIHPKALIAPHAGYLYSGAIAGSAYALLREERAVIHRILLLGPSHRVAFRGIAASSATFFATPLGEVPVDQEAVTRLVQQRLVRILDRAHEAEHGLEVHLPFLQRVLDTFSVVPLVVGQASPEEVKQVVDATWGGAETRIIISSDLSHYYPYRAAQALDRRTAEAIERLDPNAISEEAACGRIAIQGLLASARAHHLQARTIDLRNSGDTAGPRDQVVGYGAFALA